jgi:hypothetical protein
LLPSESDRRGEIDDGFGFLSLVDECLAEELQCFEVRSQLHRRSQQLDGRDFVAALESCAA